jgi:geranylgeranylglycerol-phosphate geranylgeranyltransferase
MIGAAVKVIGALTPFDTCVIVFLLIFLPTYYFSNNFVFSLTHALPLLTISICGFVINDLRDIEKDRKNHPNRPLPSSAISEIGASVIYFSLLGASLILIKLYVELPYVYLYLLFLIGLVNYNASS